MARTKATGRGGGGGRRRRKVEGVCPRVIHLTDTAVIAQQAGTNAVLAGFEVTGSNVVTLQGAGTGQTVRLTNVTTGAADASDAATVAYAQSLMPAVATTVFAAGPRPQCSGGATTLAFGRTFVAGPSSTTVVRIPTAPAAVTCVRTAAETARVVPVASWTTSAATLPLAPANYELVGVQPGLFAYDVSRLDAVILSDPACAGVLVVGTDGSLLWYIWTLENRTWNGPVSVATGVYTSRHIGTILLSSGVPAVAYTGTNNRAFFQYASNAMGTAWTSVTTRLSGVVPTACRWSPQAADG